MDLNTGLDVALNPGLGVPTTCPEMVARLPNLLPVYIGSSAAVLCRSKLESLKEFGVALGWLSPSPILGGLTSVLGDWVIPGNSTYVEDMCPLTCSTYGVGRCRPLSPAKPPLPPLSPPELPPRPAPPSPVPASPYAPSLPERVVRNTSELRIALASASFVAGTLTRIYLPEDSRFALGGEELVVSGFVQLRSSGRGATLDGEGTTRVLRVVTATVNQSIGGRVNEWTLGIPAWSSARDRGFSTSLEMTNVHLTRGHHYWGAGLFLRSRTWGETDHIKYTSFISLNNCRVTRCTCAVHPTAYSAIGFGVFVGYGVLLMNAGLSL